MIPDGIVDSSSIVDTNLIAVVLVAQALHSAVHWTWGVKMDSPSRQRFSKVLQSIRVVTMTLVENFLCRIMPILKCLGAFFHCVENQAS
jgi:hypothetical protein